MMNKDIKINMSNEASFIIDTLENKGCATFAVGGCVRDSLLKRNIHDWDICTSAIPQEVVDIFKNLGYKVIPTGLKHGTVTVVIGKTGYEITTFRIDGEYKDSRHPKKVNFTNSLKEDLLRRDFTINAMAYNNRLGLVDYFGGLEDLNNKVIKCVGNPIDRFNEDALRMMRAVRFSSQLGFEIDNNTYDAIIDLYENIQNISKERIRDEFCKILISDNFIKGLYNLTWLHLMDYIIPEIYSCIRFNQYNKHHDKDVFQYILSVVENTPPKLELRLAALLHDIGKTRCFTQGEDEQGHFIGHHKISADMSREILTRLKFDNKTIDKVCLLAYEHMIDIRMKKPGIKRLISRVGQENIEDLIQICIADRKSMAKEYQDYSDILELKARIIEILNNKEPYGLKDLNINGKDLIQLGLKQGRFIEVILNQLLERVLESPKLNQREKLIILAKDMIERL